jgi:hypothetical protein
MQPPCPSHRARYRYRFPECQKKLPVVAFVQVCSSPSDALLTTAGVASIWRTGAKLGT